MANLMKAVPNSESNSSAPPADPEVVAVARRRQFSRGDKRRILAAADRCSEPCSIPSVLAAFIERFFGGRVQLFADPLRTRAELLYCSAQRPRSNAKSHAPPLHFQRVVYVDASTVLRLALLMSASMVDLLCFAYFRVFGVDCGEEGPNVADPPSTSGNNGHVVYDIMYAGRTPGGMPCRRTF